MQYLNFHTHCLLPEGEKTVASFGLHPWHLTADWTERLPELESALAVDGTFVGECGLDKVCQTPYTLQLEAFEAQIALSERLCRPLILHCVRATDDVLRLKRGTRQVWIWHGFRGKPEQLQQLLEHGFYISFGIRFNEVSLASCPLDRLFLETDDAPQPIVPLYEAVARRRSLSVEALREQMWTNLRAVAYR